MLDKINSELKAACVGVAVEQRGQRLYLRGTFPPKPGSGRDRPHQQVISLSVYANPAGFRRAKAEALRVGGLLACKEFRWEDFGFEHREAEAEVSSIAHWLEKFKQDYFQRHAQSPKSEGSFRGYKWAFATVFGSDTHLPMTAEVCLRLLLQNTQPDSCTRQVCCKKLTTLMRFAGIQLKLNPYWGKYQQKEIILPTDAEIIAGRKSISDPEWRWRYGIMATYGIRNHELFYLNLKDFDKPPGILRVRNGAKGKSHSVWPYRAEWHTDWGLADECYPLEPILGKSNSALGDIVREAFREYKIPFNPYALRHAWAIRSLQEGLDVAAAARMMDHSVEIHCRTYHQWITDEHLNAAWEKSISRSRGGASQGE